MFRVTLALLVAFAGSGVAVAQHWFDSPRYYPESSLGRIQLVEDMDGASGDDLLWISPTSVQVWFNDGFGDFTAGPLTIPDLVLDLPAVNPRTYPQVGDVNGDSEKDLVFGLDLPYPEGRIAVYFGLGSGSFSGSTVIAPPDPAYAGAGFIQHVVLGDVDNDGVMEIAEAHDTSVGSKVADRRSSIAWWDWNGSSFVSSIPLLLQGDLACVSGLAALHLDADGCSDLMVAGTDGNSGSTSLVKILPTVGGNATLGASFLLAGNVAELAAGDLDGDGDEDVLAAHSTLSGTCPLQLRLTALENQGATTFVAIDSGTMSNVELSCDLWPKPLLGDWDGDGDLDAYLGHHYFSIYENDGSNLFSRSGGFEQERQATYWGHSAAAADLNQDGREDFVGPRTVTFGDGKLPALPEDPLPFTTQHFLAADWEGDGDIDLMERNLYHASNDATGTFTSQFAQVPLTPLGYLYTKASAVDDFDGDGLPDLLVEYHEAFLHFTEYVGMNLLVDDGLGSYTDLGTVIPGVIPISAYPDNVLRRGADYDGDGDQDLPYQDGFHVNQAGDLSLFQSYFTATDIADVADLDGNLHQDVLTLFDDGAVATYSLQRNQGGLSYVAEPLVTRSTGELGYHARFADLDEDGDLDLVIPASSGNDALYVVENVGGVLSPALTLTAGSGQTQHVVVADVDADGRVDLICDRQQSGASPLNLLQVFRRNGSGLTYDAGRSWLADDPQDFVDVDGDGDVDALGKMLVRNVVFAGADAGSIHQYGAGATGLGGAAPILGATGPLRPGSSSASVRVRRGRGGSIGLLFAGAAEADVPGFANTSLYVQAPYTLVAFVLSGPVDSPGAGQANLPIASSALTLVAGQTAYLQYVILDSAAAEGSLVATGGLELVFGAP